MRTSFIIGVSILATAYSGTALAADRCELFAEKAQAGTKLTMTVPAVTATKAVGSPLGSTWANTSERFASAQLGSLDKKISSAKVFAGSSDMAVYLFRSGQFSGEGRVLHCKKGFNCTIDLGTEMDNQTSSVICQREFFRKAKFSSPNVDPALVYFTALLNPSIDMKRVSELVDTAAKEIIENASEIDAYRPKTSDDGTSLWSRSTWITNYDHCKRFAYPECQTSADKFKDLFRISKRFEVDVDNAWVDINPFMDDDYVIQADWYIRPVIDDVDANASTPNELHYWWATRDIWVEAGDLHDRVENKVKPIIRGIDIQGALRAGSLLLMSETGCASCVDGKERLQFSIHSAANIGKSHFIEEFTMDSTHPKMVLNTSRDAVYPD